MKKIPTLFVRNPDDRRYVLPYVTAGCEWVLAGEGFPTRKYDGTCVMFDGDRWWARREVKPGKPTPPGFLVAQVDETTGKTVGWEPAEQSAFHKYLVEAIRRWEDSLRHAGMAGTYELVGPKINGNPEGLSGHWLARHGDEHFKVDALTFEGIRDAVLASEYEGIVWHHPDGRMAKIKRRDFPQ